MSDHAEALAAHNQGKLPRQSYRTASDSPFLPARKAASVHGHRPDLEWDQKLTQDAQHWANHLASIDKLVHSSERDGQGENIAFYAGTNAKPSLMAGVSQWLAEVSKYHGEKIGETGPGGNYEKWGHYTQVRACLLLYSNVQANESRPSGLQRRRLGLLLPKALMIISMSADAILLLAILVARVLGHLVSSSF